MGRPPAFLGLNEMSNWSKLWHAFRLDLGYSTHPCKVPPYCGTPKLPMAHSYLPLSSLGDVTWMLFFSTTNLPAAASAKASTTTTSSASHLIMLPCPDQSTRSPTEPQRPVELLINAEPESPCRPAGPGPAGNSGSLEGLVWGRRGTSDGRIDRSMDPRDV